MKLITSVLILALTGTAMAQAPANKNAAAPVARTAAASVKPAASTSPAKVPAKPATSQAMHPSSATAAPKSATVPAKTAAKPAVKKPTATAHKHKNAAKTEPKPAVEAAPDKKPEGTVSSKNRRDPFLSIVMSREGPACAGAGKKCIAIDQVTLQGVVRAPSGSIAVVSSGARKTYFLRENDPVYNGVVVKISPDSIVFRETVMDRLGKTSQREVVKKIQSAPAA